MPGPHCKPFPAPCASDCPGKRQSENRKYLKEKGIKLYGKPLGRPPKNDSQTASQKYRDKKEAAKRNHVEGKFGQGKRGYGLNNIMARLPETSESWANAIFFVMNLAKLLQVAEKCKGSFALLLKKLKTAIKNLLRLELFDKNLLLNPISNSCVA